MDKVKSKGMKGMECILSTSKKKWMFWSVVESGDEMSWRLSTKSHFIKNKHYEVGE